MLKKINLAEQAYSELVKKIVSGEYPAGTRLTEEALTVEFGISRTPVREALMKLESEGLVEPLPGRGCRVRSFDREAVEELYACRETLELAALAAAIGNIPEAELDELAAALRRKVPARERIGLILEADETMHLLFADYCGNRYLKNILTSLLRQTAPFRNYRNREGAAAPAALAKERLAMLGAIRSRNLPEASRLLKEHLRKGKEAVAGKLS